MVEEDLLWSGGCSHLQENWNYNLSVVDKKQDYVKILNDLSLAQEGRHLCGEEWIFQQDKAAKHNASITKKYLLEQKTRLLDHPACSLDFNPKED